MVRRPATRALGTIALIGVLAACGTDDAAVNSPVTEPASEEAPGPTSPTTTSTDVTVSEPDVVPPAFPDTTRRQQQRSSPGALLVLTDVRVAEHRRFDRIVLEFSGSGIPGWSAGYVDEAVRDGSGEVVKLDGDSILDLYASGTTAPAPDYYSGPRRPRTTGDDITDVYVVGTFEGDTQVLAGIGGTPVPYRIFALTEPSRLVIDVADEGRD